MTPFRKLLLLANDDPALRKDLVPALQRFRTAAQFDHGYDQPLAGGTDVMKRLQDELLIEQGRKPRDPNPRLAASQDLQKRLAAVVRASPEVRQVVLDVVVKHATDTGRTVVLNAAVEDIIDAAVGIALDPVRLGKVLARHTIPE